MTLFKAIRSNGRDFYTNTVQWAPEKTRARKGRLVEHPTSRTPSRDIDGDLDFTTFLSVSTDPTRLPGAGWPLRLLEVEAVGDLVSPSEFKRGGTAFRVVKEVDASLRFGPMGTEIVSLIERAATLTYDEGRRLDAARGAAWDAARGAARGAARDAAWDAARDAAWDAARDAAWGAAWGAALDAAWDAAWALVVRDLIGKHGKNGFTQAHYDILTGPWAKIIGKVHPDDADRLVR